MTESRNFGPAHREDPTPDTPPVVRGESEAEFGVHYHDEPEFLTDEQKLVGLRGAQQWREALEQAKQTKHESPESDN